MVANLNRDAGYTNATAFFSSKLIVDNKGGSIYVCSEAKYGLLSYSAPRGGLGNLHFQSHPILTVLCLPWGGLGGGGFYKLFLN